MILEYIVLRSDSLNELTKEVNNYISEKFYKNARWEPLGGVACDNYFYQAMILKEI